jgi:hypothetical protein
MIPVEKCINHDYVWLATKTEVSSEPFTRVIPKDIYCCTHCGLGMDIYDLANKIDINRSE